MAGRWLIEEQNDDRSVRTDRYALTMAVEVAVVAIGACHVPIDRNGLTVNAIADRLVMRSLLTVDLTKRIFSWMTTMTTDDFL